MILKPSRFETLQIMTQTKMNEEVSQIDWSPVYETNDVSFDLKYFSNQLKSVFDNHVPLIEKQTKGKKSPWLSKKSMNDRDSLLRKARKSKHKNDWTAYKRLRNFCINSVKRSKAKFYKNLVDENTLNPRKF